VASFGKEMAGVMTATVPRRRNLAQEGVPVNALMHPLAPGGHGLVDRVQSVSLPPVPALAVGAVTGWWCDRISAGYRRGRWIVSAVTAVGRGPEGADR
jgi:hypothetical protein